jgi:hypothetical protein
MRSDASIQIVVDEGSLAWLDELTTRLLAFGDLVQRPIEIVELIRRLPDRAAAFNLRSLPTGLANDYRIVLEASEALLGLMTSLRALDRDRHFVDKAHHVTPSSRSVS